VETADAPGTDEAYVYLGRHGEPSGLLMSEA
jgi:hypothetical protein